MPYTVNHTNTFVFLAIFILAFFPSLFNSLLRLPLLPFSYLASSPTTAVAPTSTCCCCTPTTITSPPTTTQEKEAEAKMSWMQKTFTLPPKSRGSYLIDEEVLKNVPEIKQFKVGLLNLFVQHTSCALSLNENWDSDVRFVLLLP